MSSSRLRPSSGVWIHFVYLVVGMNETLTLPSPRGRGLIQRLLVAISLDRVIAIELLRRRLAFRGGVAAFFGTADLVDRIQAFQNHFAGRCADCPRISEADGQIIVPANRRQPANR